MKNNRVPYFLSVAAILISITNLTVFFSLQHQNKALIQKMDETSEQLLRLGTVTEKDKGVWTEEASPGLNYFHGEIGHFTYPSAWGEPDASTTHFEKSPWAGRKWTLVFPEQGMGQFPWMEAYWHAPDMNVRYPFDMSVENKLDPELIAASKLAISNSPRNACEMHKLIHELRHTCEGFSESVVYIWDDSRSEGGNEEYVWFVESPTRADGQNSRYTGFLIHSPEEYKKDIEALLKTLGAPGTGDGGLNIDPSRLKDF